MNRRAIVVVMALVSFGWFSLGQGQAVQSRAESVVGLSDIHLSADQHWLLVPTADGLQPLQPNFTYRASFIPNDPQYPLQWNFIDINVPAAWDVDQTNPTQGGDPGVIIAVLDTGLAYENFSSFVQAPDLAQTRIWTNPNETADGLDNDGNGLIDDLHGWDYINHDAHPNDDNSHGTHVTGTIAQSTDNSLAVAGIAYHSTIMPLKVLNSSGNGTTATIAAGINYAVAKGADIINLSLGGDNADPVLLAAIQSAAAQGVVMVAAAGNAGVGTIEYPARYDEVIAVGATQYDRTKAPYANTGPQLDLVAPGGNLSLDQNSDGQPDGILQQTCATSACNSFVSAFAQGTSQATAHVSGVAALLGACGAPSGSIAQYLTSTAVDLGTAGWDPTFGSGLLNASAALTAAGCTSQAPAAPTNLQAFSPAGTSRQLWKNEAYPYAQPRFTWSGPSGATYRVGWGKGNQTLATTVQVATSFVPTMITEGVYRLEVQTVNQAGQTSPAQSFTYRYRLPVFMTGQTSQTLGVRLYRPAPSFIRSWIGGLGTAPVQVVGGPLLSDGTHRILVTGQPFGRSLKVKDTRGRDKLNIVPFGSNYTGSIDLAVMRRPGEGQFVASTRSVDAQLKWYTAAGKLVRSQRIYATYRGGLELASGDLTGDGVDELIVTMSRGQEVRVYDWNGRRLSVFSPLGKNWRGGFAVTTGDLDGDGNAEIIITPRTGGGNAPVFLTTLRGVVKKIWRLNTGSYRGEMDIQGLDVDGNGIDELLAVNKSGFTFVQEWGLDGTKRKQYPAKSDGRGSSLGALR